MFFAKAPATKTIAKSTGYFLQQAADLIETLFDFLKSKLESGKHILIRASDHSGASKKQTIREGRNTATRELLTLTPERVVTFK